jgi:hypothetical protein
LKLDTNGKLWTQLLWQLGWFQLLHRQLSLPMKQYSNSICMWCLYLEGDLVWKSLFDIRSLFFYF